MHCQSVTPIILNNNSHCIVAMLILDEKKNEKIEKDQDPIDTLTAIILNSHCHYGPKRIEVQNNADLRKLLRVEKHGMVNEISFGCSVKYRSDLWPLPHL